MKVPKPKVSFLVVAALIITTFVIVSCNDNASEEHSVAPPAETIDTLKMDTATTRPPPVKTTN